MNKTKKDLLWLERLVAIDELIRTGSCQTKNISGTTGLFPTREQIARITGCGVRTVQRLIEQMKQSPYDAPIEYDAKERGYCYAKPLYQLRTDLGDYKDLVHLILAKASLEQYQGVYVGDHFRRMYKQISENIEEKIPVAELERMISFYPYPAPIVNMQIWRTVLKGLVMRRTIEVLYLSPWREDRRDKVKIEPLHLCNLHGEWVVIGHCPEISGHTYSQFNLARMKTASVLRSGFVVPDDFAPEKELERIKWKQQPFDEQTQAVFRFPESVAPLVKDRKWHEQQQIEELAGGGLQLSFPLRKNKVGSYWDLVRWVLGWGQNIEVLAPDALRQEILKQAREMVKMHTTQ